MVLKSSKIRTLGRTFHPFNRFFTESHLFLNPNKGLLMNLNACGGLEYPVAFGLLVSAWGLKVVGGAACPLESVFFLNIACNIAVCHQQ